MAASWPVRCLWKAEKGTPLWANGSLDENEKQSPFPGLGSPCWMLRTTSSHGGGEQLPPWDLLPQKALEPAGVALPWEGLSSFAGSQQWGFPGWFRGLAVDPQGGRGLPVKGRWVRYGLRGQQRRPLKRLLACGGTGEGRPPMETPVLSSLSYQGVDNRRL